MLLLLGAGTGAADAATTGCESEQQRGRQRSRLWWLVSLIALGRVLWT